MSLLLYCVLPHLTAREHWTTDIPGVAGQPVAVASAAGLAAVISEVDDTVLVPDLQRLTAYEGVVERFFAHSTLVPMRYGASFPGQAELLRYLEEHAQRMRDMLSDLDGCAEMGIRVLAAPLPKPELASGAPSSGRAYLEALRRRVEPPAPLLAQRPAIIRRYVTAFEGLTVRCRSELSPPSPALERMLTSNEDGALLLASLYFLVKRDLLEAFQAQFRELRPEAGTKLLISGPWPPFSFVAQAP